jgi:sec-independent protein translocase protein TatB
VIDFGFDKLALIGAVALIVIGPEKLPRVARTVGHMLGKAQRYVADVKAEVNRSIELDELKKMKTQFEDAASSVRTEVQQAGAAIETGWSELQSTAAADPAAPYDSLQPSPPQYKHPKKLAPEARRHAAVVQAARRHPYACAIGRGAGGALPAAGREASRLSP